MNFDAAIFCNDFEMVMAAFNHDASMLGRLMRVFG
jgi:hypothetical protein